VFVYVSLSTGTESGIVDQLRIRNTTSICLLLEDSDIVNERPCRCGTTVEGQHIVAHGSNSDGEELEVGESGSDGGDDLAVPEDVDEGGRLKSWGRERAGLEEVDAVLLARDSGERLLGSEGTCERVLAGGGSEEGDGIALVREGLEEEDGSIEGTAGGGGTDPVGRGGVEAEVSALSERLEASVDGKVVTLVATGEGDLEITLAGVDGSGSICNDEVHGASVGGWVTVDDSSPDVEELTCASLTISTAGVALRCARIYIISVEEGEAHVSGSIVGSTEGTENKLIAFGISGIDQGGR